MIQWTGDNFFPIWYLAPGLSGLTEGGGLLVHGDDGWFSVPLGRWVRRETRQEVVTGKRVTVPFLELVE